MLTKPGDQQADGEETANAVEQEGRAPAPADAHESLEQRIGTDDPGMASKLPVDDVYRRRAEGRRLMIAPFFMLSQLGACRIPWQAGRTGTALTGRAGGSAWGARARGQHDRAVEYDIYLGALQK